MLTPFLARVFLTWLFLTVAIESVALVVVVRRVYGLTPADLPWRFLVIAGVTASMTTYPYLWFVAPVFVDDYVYRHCIAEPLIILTESVILYGILRVGWRRAFVASLVCNVASIIVGIPLNRWVVAAGWVN